MRERFGSWIGFLRHRFGPPPRGFAECQVEGCRLRYRPETHERFIIGEVWDRDEYGLDDLTLPDGAVIDVGAHIGAFSVKARARFPRHAIVAVEPVPDNFALLQVNLRLNRCVRVQALRVAILAERGSATIHRDPANTAGHSAVFRPSDTTVRTTAITLIDLLERCRVARVALLKFDCEGAEYGIMLASPPHLWDRVANIVVEYHPVDGHSFGELQALLATRGFRLRHHKDGYVPGQGTARFSK